MVVSSWCKCGFLFSTTNLLNSFFHDWCDWGVKQTNITFTTALIYTAAAAAAAAEVLAQAQGLYVCFDGNAEYLIQTPFLGKFSYVRQSMIFQQ